METKKCTKCGEIKPVTEFHKAGIRNEKQQYRTHCVACTLHPETARRWALRGQGLKQCSKCKQVLPFDNFYDDKRKADGKREVCKTCHVTTTTEYRKSAGHEVFIRAKIKYNHKPENQRKRADYMRKQRFGAVWATQESARHAVNTAVANGSLPRASECVCADCGATAAQYHHESYEQDHWLDVVALCGPCHKRRHSQ